MRLARRYLFGIACTYLLAGVGFGAYAAYLQVVGNFHTVIEGEFYRSAQPSATQLAAYVRTHGIKTVINLRGEDARAVWYENELATARRLGVQHIDYRMSASRTLTPAQADEVVAIMAAAPKPILVHCQAGSDRTGLVSALYSYRLAGQSEERAERQLSLVFGHVGIPHISAAYAMDASWEVIEDHYRPKG